jgi:tetratricopeptide (TPR) repeat protein
MINDQIAELEKSLEMLWQTHRNDFIIDTARKILNLDPQHQLANYCLIFALYRSHKYEEMFEAVQIALKYWSNRPWLHEMLYLYYLYKGGQDYIKAKEHIEIAIKLDPINAQYYRDLGEIYLINREPQKAAIYLSQAVRLKPANAEYRSRYALSLLRCHRLKECFQMADKALKDGVNDANVYDSVGMIYTLAGELDKGEELFKVALRMVPTYDYFQKHIDWVLAQKKDKQNRLAQNKKYTPLYLRHKGTKRFFDEDKK